jgi:hypothetical protein
MLAITTAITPTYYHKHMLSNINQINQRNTPRQIKKKLYEKKT